MTHLSNEDIMRMPLSEAIKPENGGTGLASAPFQIPRTFFNIFGWQNVDADVETLVIDGKEVSKTKLTADFEQFIGKRSYARRVVLKPAPLDVEVSGHSGDDEKYSVTLRLTLSYILRDPVLVAQQSAPLTIFSSIVKNAVLASIPRYTQAELFGHDLTDIKLEIATSLANEDYLKKLFDQIEILYLTVSGDESVLDVKRRQATAEAEGGLAAAEGRGKLVAAEFDLAIERGKAKLVDEQRARDHQRELEKQDKANQAATERELIKALAKAAPYAEVGKIAQAIGDALGGRASTTPQDSAVGKLSGSNPAAGAENRLERERQALNGEQAELGIRNFKLFQADGRLTGARIEFSDFRIDIQCPPNYPLVAPNNSVQYRDGSARSIAVRWVANNNSLLVHYVIALMPLAEQAIPQAKRTATNEFDILNDEDES